jgi:16S rRNA (guanine527-N7)-methyltransferase
MREMAGNVVNLNRFRKKKQRDAKAQQAETNRIRHGRTQAEKDREHAQRQRAERAIEGKRLEREVLSVPGLAVPEGMGERLASLGAHVSAGCLVTIGDYLARLLAMNEEMNLTAITDPSSAWERHAFDALSLLAHVAHVSAGGRLVDIGSGGGVPGIPLAIARPDLHVTLVEATQKKARFLQAVSDDLGLTHVTVHAQRAEELATGPLAGQFDVVTARAVARLARLVPLVVPFARLGGRLLLIKGQRVEEELEEAKAALAAHHLHHEGTIATPTGRIVILVRAG